MNNEEYNTLGELPEYEDMPKLRGFEEGRPVRKSLPVRNDLDTYVRCRGRCHVCS